MYSCIAINILKFLCDKQNYSLCSKTHSKQALLKNQILLICDHAGRSTKEKKTSRQKGGQFLRACLICDRAGRSMKERNF